MSEIIATPLIDNTFWIIEEDGNRIATLQRDENDTFLISNNNGDVLIKNEADLTTQFGSNFFIKYTKPVNTISENNECYGYPTGCKPYNQMYDVKRKLPVFTKSEKSKSVFCAGYYRIKFDYYWNITFCPKRITVDRYPTIGPFKTEAELKLSREYDRSN